MVRFGTDLARVTLMEGNQLDSLHLYGICIDYKKERSSRILELKVNFVNKQKEAVVYQDQFPIAKAFNYVCHKLQ